VSDSAAPELGALFAQRTFGPLTRTDLRHYAEASGDFNPLHLDQAFAREAGFEDVIAHGMLGMALLGRLLTEHVPQPRLLRFRVRFRQVIKMGEPLVCTARLTGGTEKEAVLRLLAHDAKGGLLMDGTATIAAPVPFKRLRDPPT
jgi:3-hydroxybutyryl-CoA dehydratase